MERSPRYPGIFLLTRFCPLCPAALGHVVDVCDSVPRCSPDRAVFVKEMSEKHALRERVYDVHDQSDRAYVTSVLFEFFILIPQITQISNTERY